MDEDYRVELDVYNGPLDLLLYLIRRDEIDIHDIPIARITEQYVQYIELIKQFDPNMAGDFLVMAATLIAIKTRMLLPAGTEGEGDEDDEFGIDPRSELVRQLLEYKKFKDAAGDLLAAAQLQTMQHPRNAPALKVESDDLDIEDAQVWNLMDAFSKVLTAIGQNAAFHEVIYDDTPIELYEVDIVDRLQRDGAMTFEKIFEGCRNRGQLVGLFMALLELVRLQKVLTRQERNFRTITIELNPKPPTEEQLAAMGQPAGEADQRPAEPAADDAVMSGDSDEHRDTSD